MMIRKRISATGELYVFMNGQLLYKKWNDGTSMIVESYGINTRNDDRDRGSYVDVRPVDDDKGLALSTEGMANMVVSLLDEGVPDHTKEGVRALFTTAVDLLYWAEDNGGPKVTPSSILPHLELDDFLTLVAPKHNVPPALRKQLDAYVWNLFVTEEGSSPSTGEVRHKEWQTALEGVLSKLVEVYADLTDMAFEPRMPTPYPWLER